MSQKKQCDVAYPGVLFSPEHLSPPTESSHILSFTNNTLQRTVKWKAHTVMQDSRGHVCVCLLSLGGFWKGVECGRCYGRFPDAWGAWKDSFINLIFLQDFKGRPRKNRFGSCQARNSLTTLFQLCFESSAPHDLMLCWKLTRVLSTPACQNLTRLPPGFFCFCFSFHLILCTLTWKGRWWLRNQQIRDLNLLQLVYILYPQEVEDEKSHAFIMLIILIKYTRCTQKPSASCYKENIVFFSSF